MTCRRDRLVRVLFLLIGPSALASAASQNVQPEPRLPVEELRLDNGMRVLLVQRPETTMVAAGWAARVGSADETPGRTGASHLIEHMLFKGSRAVGTRRPEREEKILAEIDRVEAEIRELEDSPRSTTRDGRLTELSRRFEELRARARELIFPGEFSLLYSEAGGVGLDASTLRDLTFYSATIPAERLELWFWLESDRLLQPVFREFHKEKAVVAEERRLRIEATPGGRVDEEIEAAFWRPLAYAWRPLGLAGDLERITRADLTRFFAAHYRPSNLTAALVGGFDPARARELARRYFGRLSGPDAANSGRAEPLSPAPAVATLRRTCECPAEARALYRTVAFRHPDSYPLQVLAGLLSGRTGRLHRSLVLEREIAFAASAGQHPLRRAGHFEFRAETRGTATPDELIEAWDAELALLVDEPIPDAELDKVRNQLSADAFRRLKDPGALMKQLLIYDALGDWREINDWARRIRSVRADDVRAAARRYLRADRRLVALVERRGPAASSPIADGG